MTTEEKIQTIRDKVNICWETNGINPTAFEQFNSWFCLMIDTDPGFGDWDDPAAEPYLDDAIDWLDNFITTHGLS